MANNKSKTDPKKRYAQNVRTFQNVQSRRKKHAESHGVTVESLGAKRWVDAPKAKN